MADKLGLGSESKQLKLGQSFTNPKSAAFHTIRYDFKPASVDVNKMATVEVGSNHQVSVTVPHLDGAGVPQTVFKGSQRPYQKECVLIIDKLTGEITLEKLNSNIQVKKTRNESIKPQLSQVSNSGEKGTSAFGTNRPQTPPIGQRTSNKTRVTSGGPRANRSITSLPTRSPLHTSPNYASPAHHKSPKRDHHINVDSHPQSTLASLPMIGDDDFTSSAPSLLSVPHQQHSLSSQKSPEKSPNFLSFDNQIGEISDSSSSSDSDMEDNNMLGNNKSNGYSNGISPATKTSFHPTQILNEDLQLSDSESD